MQRRSAKTAVVGFAALVLMGTVAIGVVRFDAYFECRECHSGRELRQWNFELFRLAMTLRTSEDVVHDSLIRQQFYPNGHAHEWRLGVATETGLLRGGIIDGDLSPEIAVRYESNSDFRAFVRGEVAEGRLSSPRLMQMFALGQYRHDIDAAGLEGVRIDQERQALLAKYEKNRMQPNIGMQPTAAARPRLMPDR